jgi:hypothetical protein
VQARASVGDARLGGGGSLLLNRGAAGGRRLVTLSRACGSELRERGMHGCSGLSRTRAGHVGTHGGTHGWRGGTRLAQSVGWTCGSR